MEKFFQNAQKQQHQQQQQQQQISRSSDQDVAKGDDASEGKKKTLPKGVVLGPDGKPCRSCTSVSAWMKMANAEASSSSSSSTNTSLKGKSAASTTTTTVTEPSLPSHCPPDVETLGRSTWTFLHTLSASYPSRASPTQQSEMSQFLGLFGKLYPCWHCAEDFRSWMGQRGNEPRVGGREELGRWMCEAHNEVNRKLGKEEFDCGKWRERWKDGPGDGSCG